MTQSNRFLPYTRWPDALAQRYRAKGYWRGEPLTAMLARQCELAPDAEAILCGDRRFSYGELDAASSRLAGRLARHERVLARFQKVCGLLEARSGMMAGAIEKPKG